MTEQPQAVVGHGSPVLDAVAFDEQIVRKQVKTSQGIFTMVVAEDLSMADREELRLLMVQIHTISEAGTKRGKTTPAEKKALTDLEHQLLVLALRDSDGEPIEMVVAKKLGTVERNVILEAFWEDVDILGTTTRLLQKLVGKTRRAGATSTNSATSAPPAPPSNLMPLRPQAAASDASTKRSGKATSSSQPEPPSDSAEE